MELASLRAALDEAGRLTRTVVVEGQAGIGKTRLVEELCVEAARRGDDVLWGRAFEGGAAPAFWSWLPPLRTLAERYPDRVVVPELAALLSPDGPVDGLEPTSGVPGSAAPARFALLEAVMSLLEAAASERRVVLVLDDVQWADEASLELLAALPSRLTTVPLLVVATVRELDLGRTGALVDTLAALARSPGSRRIELRGLGPADASELVAQAAGTDLDPASARTVRERADGNPFFITELARLLASGAPVDDVPAGVRDVLRRRLSLLPAATVELLQVAAVMGRDADLALLHGAAGRSLDQCLDELEPAVVQRLLVPVADQPGSYRFAHALVREVLVDDISPLRRARLHLRVADALDPSDDNAEILAEHLWEAAPIGTGARAADALEHAARVAVRRLAYASAAQLLERAVQLRHAVTDPGARAAELRALAFLTSVTTANRGYAALNGSPLLARGKRLAQDTGSTFELLNLLWAEWAGFDTSCRFDLADPIAEELLRISSASDLPFAPVLGHTAYGISCWHQARITESAEHLDLATELAAQIPRQGDGAPLFDADQLRLSTPFSVYVHVLVGDVDDPVDRFESVVRVLPDDPFWLLLVMNFMASGALSTGQAEVAEQAAHRGIAADPDRTFAFWSHALHGYLGAARCLQGHLDEGMAAMRQAWDAYTATGSRTNGATWFGTAAYAAGLAGRADEGAALLEVAHHELRTYRDLYAGPTVRLGEAAVAAAGGADGDDVAAMVGRAATEAESHGSHGIAAWVRRAGRELGVAATAPPG